jgi:chitodextrinase
MAIAETLLARAVSAAVLVLLALPALAAANPGTGPELIQRSGRLVVLHADHGDGTSTQQWMLIDGTSRVRVRTPDVWIDPGTPVRLEGTMHNGSLVLSDSLTAVRRTGHSPLQADAAQVAATPSVENTAVILVSFDNGGPAWPGAGDPTQPQATSLMFDPPGTGPGQRPDSLNAYYLEQTYGQISFSGTVFGPVTVHGPSSDCGTGSPYWPVEHDSLYSWLDEAELAAGINPSNDSAWKHVVLALPAGVNCPDVAGAAGLAEVGGNHVWINGSFAVPVLAHELGHNLGLSHAGGLHCTDAGSPAPMGSSCSANGFEYADPFDAMGNAPVLRQMNMEHKLLLNLLPASAQQVIGVTGTYHVAPMETLTGTAEVLRLPKPGGGSYFVEYRDPDPLTGGYFDNQAPAFNGVYVRTESPQLPGYPNRADTALIDMHPTTGSPPWVDARMTVGQVFNDPLRGILIQDLAEDAHGATLAITMPADTTPPSSPGGLSAVASGTGVSLQWTAAGDDVGVASYRVSRDGTQLAAQTAMTFDDSGLPPGVTVTYAVTAVDIAGNVGPPATISVTLPDTLAPSAPLDVTAVVSRDGHVHIAWGAAQDNVGVTSYRILRAGTGIIQANVLAYVDTMPRAGAGATVTYSVIAFDAVGNAGPAGVAKPLRAALLRKLGASHLKLSRAKVGKLMRVRGTLSDVKAICRARLGRGAWHPCKVAASGAFSTSMRRTRAKLVTLALRDEIGRVRLQTLRVP